MRRVSTSYGSWRSSWNTSGNNTPSDQWLGQKGRSVSERFASTCARVRVCACVRVCVCACVRACVCMCVHGWVWNLSLSVEHRERPNKGAVHMCAQIRRFIWAREMLGRLSPLKFYRCLLFSFADLCVQAQFNAPGHIDTAHTTRREISQQTTIVCYCWKHMSTQTDRQTHTNTKTAQTLWPRRFDESFARVQNWSIELRFAEPSGPVRTKNMRTDIHVWVNSTKEMKNVVMLFLSNSLSIPLSLRLSSLHTYYITYIHTTIHISLREIENEGKKEKGEKVCVCL